MQPIGVGRWVQWFIAANVKRLDEGDYNKIDLLVWV